MKKLRSGLLLHPRRPTESAKSFRLPPAVPEHSGEDQIIFGSKLTGTSWDLNHRRIVSLLIATFHTLY